MLEERVGTLLERFQQAQKRIEDLEAELAQRDAQAGVLERRVEEFRLRLEGENRKREELRLRVSHLIEEISRIEARERKRASGKHPA
jgi:chromosome segregation ATPase